MVVYPNPTKEHCNILINNHQFFNKKIIIQISDTKGKIIRNESIVVDYLNYNLKLDLSNLSPGQYIISIIAENIIQSYKIIIVD